MNWNRLALIAPHLWGSSIFLNHTITKALFSHTHVHSINIWVQETKHRVAMATQHIQQLNSTPASVFKDLPPTFNPESMKRSGTTRISHNTQSSLELERRPRARPPRENLEKQLKPSAGSKWEEGRQSSIDNHSPRDRAESSRPQRIPLPVWVRVEGQTLNKC